MTLTVDEEILSRMLSTGIGEALEREQEEEFDDVCRGQEPSATSIPPSAYHLPHPDWRTRQFESVQWIENQEGIMVVEATTGSGKSALAVAQAFSPVNPRRTCILTRTKNLQAQYGAPHDEGGYEAHLIMGKSNYPCAHPDAQPNDTAEDCLYAENNSSMHKCSYYRSACGYGVAKEKGLSESTPLICTNYAYWLTSGRIRDSKIDLLVMDECHLLPNIVEEWAGCTIDYDQKVKWGLPTFPVIRTSGKKGIEDALRWFGGARSQLRNLFVQYQMGAEKGDDEAKKMARQVERLGYKLSATIEAIEDCREAWYVRSGPGLVYSRRGYAVPGIICKPLTARYHFRRLFPDHVDSSLLMSATVGNFEKFSKELGISKLYTSRYVPSRFPPESMPIHVLDVPKLSHRSPPSHYEKQADEIYRFLLDYPPDWSGLIHVTRIKEAPLLKERLVRRGYPAWKLWVPPREDRFRRRVGTKEQVRLWEVYRDSHEGAIAISWAWHEGYDGREEKINITAKVQFPPMGQPGSYERAKMDFSHSLYNLETAQGLMQSQGRNRRGREEDYDLDGEVRGANAIADGNWTRIKSYLSDEFLKRLI